MSNPLNVHFNNVKKNESMFPIVDFYARKILGIVGSQIEMERIFFLIRIFTSFRRCHLQLENLEKLIFVNKSWPNDPRIDCKSSSSFVELINIDVDLEEEIKKFEFVF
jgi:hypothetical protein